MRYSSALLTCIGLLASCSGALPTEPRDAPAGAERRPPLRAASATPTRSPISILIEAEQFDAAQIGFAGQPSHLVDAWLQIQRSSGAADQFAYLLRSGRTPAARMYALTGLFAVDRAAFDSVVATRAWSSDSVPVMIGCIVTTMSSDSMVSEIRAGVWDRSFRSSELPHWPERR